MKYPLVATECIRSEGLRCPSIKNTSRASAFGFNARHLGGTGCNQHLTSSRLEGKVHLASSFDEGEPLDWDQGLGSAKRALRRPLEAHPFEATNPNEGRGQ
eukprot:CAMPEP_0119380434 /NCGR_PEP_ID=MMETSP1334-20130426/56988_1 /TAXON_ID=127549 /ORGANISM="Calcidiscus leptoporus, Strain RCC1130" /LENGTH=100 /DNA_ID=CAMNT_0007400263 /DNA_START=339 /DNA_END=641 /DNA_ORIENTATION=+